MILLALVTLLVVPSVLSIPAVRAVTTASTSTAGVSMTITTDRSNYTTGDTMMISGTVAGRGNAVVIVVADPSGTEIGNMPTAIKPDGTYSFSVTMVGQGWENSGTYSVSTQLQQQDTVALPPTVTTKIRFTAVHTSVTTADIGTSQMQGPPAASDLSNLIIPAGFVVAAIVVGVLAMLVILRRRTAGVTGR